MMSAHIAPLRMRSTAEVVAASTASIDTGTSTEQFKEIGTWR
jgi:hypothetical protein